MKGLTITGLSSGYSRQPVIEDLHVGELPPGEITMLLGPNGCGKSTLLRALAGLNKARGEARLNGDNLLALPFSERAQKVVFLPQSLPQGVHLHVLESVIVALRAGGGEHRAQDKARALGLLAELGISHLAMCYLDSLSGGQKQLVGLAQALIRRPALLLLDEPLSALDLNYQFQVMEVIRQETRARRMVTLMVVHDINIALRHGGRVVMLKQGRLVASGTAEEAVTPEHLAQLYGVYARIERCSQGRPQVILDGII